MIDLPTICRLYYLGKSDDGFGWGICNTNMIRALGRHVNVIVDDYHAGRTEFEAPCFTPIGDAKLTPLRRVKAPRVLGYCFPEWPIPPEAVDAAEYYHTVFAGSTWATEKLKAAGIAHAKTLIQGVDADRFALQPWQSSATFNVFSGGKFEFRKGQDIVLAAMGRFMKAHADVTLTIAWHNPWPQTAESMAESNLIDHSDPAKDIPKDRLVVLPPLANHAMAKFYGRTHIGLFPNRAEAGNNMVMTEYMACGRPVIATTAHGHMDMAGPGFIELRQLTPDARGWFHADVDEVLRWLEWAYVNRDKLPGLGVDARSTATRYTWNNAAKQIVHEAFG